MTATITTRPQFLNANTNVYTAWDLRKAHDNVSVGPGVADYESFRVLQTQSGANLGVDIGKTAVGFMRAWVRGSTRGGQGLYRIDNTDTTAPTADTYLAQLTDGVSFTVGDATNPRVDQVILEVLDQQHVGSSNLAQIRVLVGTPTATASLDNRLGVATLPASCILLADVLMPISQATVVTANIRDRRAFPLPGTVPVPITAVDQVAFVPAPNLPPAAQNNGISNANHALQQAAVQMYLPRRIVSATRIRWRYAQDATTAITGNYTIAIYDASGRKIVDTGVVAYTGAINTWQTRSETITATTFEPGAYYVLLGNASTAGNCTPAGVVLNVTAALQSVGAIGPNIGLRSATGGTTMPNTLLAFTDVSTLAAATSIPVIPFITLSVG